MADDKDSKKDAPKEAKADKKKKASKSAASATVVELADGVKIDSTNRLAHLDVGPVQAFSGAGQKGTDSYFALVCEPHLTPRVRAASVYQSISNPHLAPLIKRGVVYWPPARQERYMLVYRDMLGMPLLRPDEKQAMGLHQDVVLEKILRPIVNCLLDFRDKDFFHGGIRATNLFNGGSNNLDSVMLGQSLAAPSSYMQPALYESIQRGMADPIARGRGWQTHDMYALGVTLAVLLRNSDPMEEFDDVAVVKQKMELGSYAAITGKDRFKGSILELLRGLLHDEDDQRWTIEEVQEWLDGRRLSPKQANPKKKADRALGFSGGRYFQLPSLAMDLELNPTETRRIIDEGDLEQWITRSLGDEDLYEHIEDTLDAVKSGGQGAGYQERLVSSISMVLDPEAPIRYKNLRAHPEGLGTALTEAMVTKQDIGIFADILSQGLPMAWMKEQQHAGLEPPMLPQNYEACSRFLRKQSVGLGLERCLYKLNPEAHCLSEKLANYHVLTAGELLAALDDACGKGMVPTLFIDRHIAAFLSEQDSNFIDDWLPQINSQDYHVRLIANLRCFSNIQKREKIGAVPHLAKAFAEMMPAVYKRFHDAQAREKLKKEVNKYAAAGDLVRMVDEVDNPAIAQRDYNAFKMAMRDYKKLSIEYADLTKMLENKKTFGLSSGRQVAALISCGLAGFVILGLTFANFFGG